MEEYLPLIIQLLSGAVGGNLIGALLKKFSLGTLGNSILGIIGALGGGQAMSQLGLDFGSMGTAVGGMDLGAILNEVTGGAAGGGVLMAIVGVVKNMLSKNSD